MAFRLAVAPGQFDGVADGANVTAQDPREPDNPGESGANGIVDPDVEIAEIVSQAAHQDKLM